MKKSVRLLLCLMIATAVFSMQLFSVCAAENSGENDTEVRISLLGKYDSADTASVKQVNTFSKTIQFRNHDTGKNYTLKYDNTSQIYDIHREPVSASLLEVGQVVDITFLKGTKHLNSLVVSDDAWVEAGVTDFNLVSNDETAKIKGTVYHLTRRTLIISDGEAVNPEDILATDTLRVSGVDKEIYSIVVTRGHGYVSLSSDKVNDRSLVGAWIELDKEVIRKITPNMLISAPEGSYNVSIAGNGTKFSSEIVVNRNEETVIDTGFVEVEEVKKGDVTFVVTPEDARLFVDGEETLTDVPHTYTYGKHKIHVMAEGYVSQDHYLKVAEADATIFIELEKDPDASESSSEEDSADSSDSAESIDSTDSSSEASYVVSNNSEVPSSASTTSTSAPDLFSSNASNSSRSSNSSTNATVDTAAASTTVSAESSTESSTDSSASSTTSASDDTDSSDTSDTSDTSGSSDTSGTSDTSGSSDTSGTSGNSGSSDTSGTSGNSGPSDTSGSSGNSGSFDTSGNSDSSDTSDTSDSSDDNIVSGYRVTFDAPIGAEVYLDDNYVGIMPVSFAKPEGQHMVTLQKAGYETKSYTIYIDSEKTNVTYTFPEMIPDRRQDSSDDSDSGDTSDSGNSGSKPDGEDSGSSSDSGNSGSKPDGEDSGSSSDSADSGSKPDSGNSGSSSDSGNTGSKPDSGNSGSSADSGNAASNPDSGNSESAADSGNAASKPDSVDAGSDTNSGNAGSISNGGSPGNSSDSIESGNNTDGASHGKSTDGSTISNGGSNYTSENSGSTSDSTNSGNALNDTNSGHTENP